MVRCTLCLARISADKAHITVDSGAFHKDCFVCLRCGLPLSADNFSLMELGPVCPQHVTIGNSGDDSAPAETTKKKKKKKQSVWTEEFDAEGDPYYFNHETGDSVWEKPDDFDGEGSDVDSAAGSMDEDKKVIDSVGKDPVQNGNAGAPKNTQRDTQQTIKEESLTKENETKLKKQKEEDARREVARKRKEEELKTKREALRKHKEEENARRDAAKRKEEGAKRDSAQKRKEEDAKSESARKRKEEDAKTESAQKRKEEDAKRESALKRKEQDAKREAAQKQKDAKENAERDAARKREEEVVRAKEKEAARQRELDVWKSKDDATRSAALDESRAQAKAEEAKRRQATLEAKDQKRANLEALFSKEMNKKKSQMDQNEAKGLSSPWEIEKRRQQDFRKRLNSTRPASPKSASSPRGAKSKQHHSPSPSLPDPSSNQRMVLKSDSEPDVPLPGDLATLFKQLDINEKHLAVFEKEELSPSDIFLLSSNELAEMVPPKGPRLRLSKFIIESKAKDLRFLRRGEYFKKIVTFGTSRRRLIYLSDNFANVIWAENPKRTKGVLENLCSVVPGDVNSKAGAFQFTILGTVSGRKRSLLLHCDDVPTKERWVKGLEKAIALSPSLRR